MSYRKENKLIEVLLIFFGYKLHNTQAGLYFKWGYAERNIMTTYVHNLRDYSIRFYRCLLRNLENAFESIILATTECQVK